MRARYPDTEGFVERNGAKVFYEVYDNEGPTILLAQSWQTAHSRLWKMQIPYLARHFRVVTYDPVGNGKSDRVHDASRYMLKELIADALAVLDTTKTDTCVAAGLSFGGGLVTTMAALHPDRFDGVIPIAASHQWGVPLEDDDGDAWERYGPEFWRDDWRSFVEQFFAACTADPHSTKSFDDSVRWAMETDGEIISIASEGGPSYELEEIEAAIRSLDMPFLLIHGTGDKIISHESSIVLQKMIPGAELLTIDGAGHIPIGRYPVKVNHAIKGFMDRVYGIERSDATWHVGHARPEKVLYISSPIGLGHARRDVAIAGELRVLQPDIQIDWLAQDPVTRVLDAAGETVHAASTLMANESAHIESESGEHDLNAFQALRNMDEIQAANFMLIDEVISDGQYDLVIGDECWELDYQLLENPNLKKASYAWLTDFVGYVPMPSSVHQTTSSPGHSALIYRRSGIGQNGTMTSQGT
jgi:pimeloyl-ACP methyl ester carboxylesterase